MPTPHDYLVIYLQDHDALLAAAIQLAQRHKEHSQTIAPHILEPMRDHLHQERQALHRIMKSQGVSQGVLTDTLAWLGERLGRLKLNGHLLTRSPLSEVTELEALTLCAQARTMFWEGLTKVEAFGQMKEPVNSFVVNAGADTAQCASLHAMAVAGVLNP